MLGSIRKFSSSIYAKIFLVIVAIPFIFWGMGPVFQSGKKNTIVEIGKEKISTQEFIDFIRLRLRGNENLNEDLIKKMLSSFIGDKLISFETDELNIDVSEKSLSQIIKNEKIFLKNNEFSRTEYEKFLVQNSLDAVTFESNLLKQNKKDQFFSFLSDGLVPSNFLVNVAYNEINQERDVQLINLNNVFKKNFNFNDDEIKKFYEDNKEKYMSIYKSIKLIELTPKNLTNSEDYNDLFFEKLDEIDDLIVEGKSLNFITDKFNLDSILDFNFNKSGISKDGTESKNIPPEIVKKVFNVNINDLTFLLENSDKYFIAEIINSENIQRKINNKSVQKDIIENLKKNVKRKSVSKIISRINNNDFKKSDFDNFSKNENVKIQSIKIASKFDDKIIKKNLINQIYSYPPKKVIVAADIDFKENYLIYIDRIKNVSIDKKSNDYEKYFNLAKVKMMNNLYNTYDLYLNEKYEIKINYNALDNVVNSLQ